MLQNFWPHTVVDALSAIHYQVMPYRRKCDLDSSYITQGAHTLSTTNKLFTDTFQTVILKQNKPLYVLCLI
jgi:hypothetical protein